MNKTTEGSEEVRESLIKLLEKKFKFKICQQSEKDKLPLFNHVKKNR